MKIPEKLRNDPTGRGLFLYTCEHPDDAAGFEIMADYCDEIGWEFDALVNRLIARMVAHPRHGLKRILADFLGRKRVPSHFVFHFRTNWKRSGVALWDAESLANLICNWQRETTGRKCR